MNYTDKFEELLHQPENEVVEIKEAKNDFSMEELGKYFSALSNEANLRGADFAWIIFGVKDKTREIVGSAYRSESAEGLQKLKHDISNNATEGLTFREIVELTIEGKRVLLFQIPAGPRNIVVRWKGVAYGRSGESLMPLDVEKSDTIRHQSPEADWSEQPVDSASLADLDDLALAKARVMYKRVHASSIPAEEIDAWSTEEFLSRSGVMIDGRLTRAALLLLGKEDSVYKLSPAVAQITWTLENKDGVVTDYQHFTIPFILSVDQVLGKIRNQTMRELPGGTLFPDTMKQYDEYSIREALHNCIAHQDYLLQERITFVESPDHLYYGNGGSFLPGTIEKALEHKGPQRHYRNQCLCTGMVNFNMIDTVGRGIKKIFTEQQKRFFPLPDYEIDAVDNTVGVTIYGKILDEKYTNLLKASTDLSLKECLWLDAVQKHHPLTEMAIKHLKDRKLIEGRKPNYTISDKIAQKTHQLPAYVRQSGLDDDVLRQMVLKLLKHAGDNPVRLSDIVETLEKAMPETLSSGQKKRRIQYLLHKMTEDKVIFPSGKYWHLKQ